MTEAGVAGEMLPQKPAMRLQDRLGKWVQETFTPTGRAEVLAQKYVDSVLAQLPEQERAKAMALLEQRRPDLVETYLPQAKGSLVRDAVIVGTSAVVLGGGTYVLSKNERVRGAVSKAGQRAAEIKLGKNTLGTILREGRTDAQKTVNQVVMWITRPFSRLRRSAAPPYADWPHTRA